jgi:hypothetical protein
MCLIDIKWSYAKLDEVDTESKNAIMYFALLWSLFESKFCNERASAEAICNKCQAIEESLNNNIFNVFLDYFKNRYVTEEGFNEKFDALNFRRHDKKALVERVLKSETNNTIDIASALLIIVYRLRNNLFHGLKWQYNIQGQYSNFDISNQLLIKMISIADDI